ncbi:hypothetical protein Cdeb_01856 [Caldibacillus debilis GB1]|uniref:Uncharacterized protein n=1 Tax=Caldibacillus debilis GB1 TaxID=1339248 RepID=A0A420VC70_9BACI|nr:hypothetical protein Cdeb_01856 [Caldibacillus debilis GB1]
MNPIVVVLFLAIVILTLIVTTLPQNGQNPPAIFIRRVGD